MKRDSIFQCVSDQLADDLLKFRRNNHDITEDVNKDFFCTMSDQRNQKNPEKFSIRVSSIFSSPHCIYLL